MNRSLASTGIYCLVFTLIFACGGRPSEGREGIYWKKTKVKRAASVPPGEWVPAEAEALGPSAEEGKQEEAKQDRTLSPYFHVHSEDPDTDLLPLKSTRADVQIAGVIAQVKVTQVYKNEGRNTLEAVYVFPASTRAAVYAMKMTIGERVIKAKIKKRKQARQDYEEARRLGQTASLLEQQRPNVFQMNVANILPGDVIKVEMEYTELLVPEDGTYEFVYPTVVGPRYSNLKEKEAPESEEWVKSPYLAEKKKPTYDFGLEATIRSGMPIARVSCPSHDVHVEFPSSRIAALELKDKDAGNRDFVLRYQLSQNQIDAGLLLFPGKKENFFLLMMEPPEKVGANSVVPREYIFIMDVSGSMSGFPINASKALMRNLLSSLRPSDCFNVVLFAGRSAVMSKESVWATRENVDKAIEVINHQSGGGGTELLSALKRALTLPRKAGTSRIVVIATDGYVHVEKESFELISKNLGKANMFTFGIGQSVNRHLIEGMAHAGMGDSFVALNEQEAIRQAAKFREYISSPVMQGIKVDFDGFKAYDVEPPAVPDLFAKRPVILFGKYRGSPKGTISISGQVPGEKLRGRMQVKYGDLSAENSALRYLWARHRVRRLSDLNVFGRDEEPKKEITRLGLNYNIMTAYTSFVAVDSRPRARGKNAVKVKQPLPLPEGVSNRAIGQMGKLGVLGTKAKGGGSIGYSGGFGGLGLSGSGRGYGGAGAYHLRQSPGKVRTGSPMIMGSLSSGEIKRVIRKYHAQIKYCYTKALKANPGLSGKVVVKIHVDKNGKVKKVEIVSSTIKSKEAEKCMLEKIKTWRFPVPPGGGEVVINYPFVFASTP